MYLYQVVCWYAVDYAPLEYTAVVLLNYNYLTPKSGSILVWEPNGGCEEILHCILQMYGEVVQVQISLVGCSKLTCYDVA